MTLLMPKELGMRLCLVEDRAASDLDPLTLTRPVFDLLLGAESIACKQTRAFCSGAIPVSRGAVVRNHLKNSLRERTPGLSVNDRAWIARGPLTVLNGRWIPPVEPQFEVGTEQWLGLCEGEPAVAVVGPELASAL